MLEGCGGGGNGCRHKMLVANKLWPVPGVYVADILLCTLMQLKSLLNIEPFCMYLLTGGIHQFWPERCFNAVAYCHVPGARCLSVRVAGTIVLQHISSI